MTTLDALLKMAGLGGFLLGIYNYWRSGKTPVHTWQRELRRALRRILITLDDGCDTSTKTIRGFRGDYPPPRTDTFEVAATSLASFSKLSLLTLLPVVGVSSRAIAAGVD